MTGVVMHSAGMERTAAAIVRIVWRAIASLVSMSMSSSLLSLSLVSRLGEGDGEEEEGWAWWISRVGSWRF